jgi:multidrug efflux pump subunit AcrA (membrane-fusion protein)
MSANGQPSKPSIFRKQALEHHRSGMREEGDVLHLSPLWMDRAYWVLMAMGLGGLLLSVLGSVREYAEGPAIIRVAGYTQLTADRAGVVATVEAHPGQSVEAGQTLMTFQATEEQRALERIRREYELLLVRFMRDPSDQVARAALSALNAELEQAKAHLEARTFRAPFAGVLGDVRFHPGQYVEAGTHLLSVRKGDAPAYLIAFLPGHYRPFLKPGMPLRVELAGFRFDYRDLRISSVSGQVMGPTELRRYLGPDISDAVKLEGPMIAVRAELDASAFTSEGRQFDYFDGMPASAWAPVRTEPIWWLLIPGWKGLFSHGG